MRLPRHKIYRAFPELDRFSDEQCELFVRRASRADTRGWKRLHVAGWLWLYSCAGLGFFFAIRSSEGVGGAAASMWLQVVGMCLLAVMLLIGFAGWGLIRDRHLIRLIRKKVLDASCPRCEYGLLGLPCIGDGEASAITCPECGTTTTLVQMGTTREEFDALRPDETVGAVREGG